MTDTNPVARLKDVIGWSHAELAARGGVTGDHARRTGQRWVRGENIPRGENLNALTAEVERIARELPGIIADIKALKDRG